MECIEGVSPGGKGLIIRGLAYLSHAKCTLRTLTHHRVRKKPIFFTRTRLKDQETREMTRDNERQLRSFLTNGNKILRRSRAAARMSVPRLNWSEAFKMTLVWVSNICVCLFTEASKCCISKPEKSLF